jgi:hypothetical protein
VLTIEALGSVVAKERPTGNLLSGSFNKGLHGAGTRLTHCQNHFFNDKEMSEIDLF